MDDRRNAVVTTEEQIEFAWHNFEDQQAIIRAADLKAGYLVPFLLVFWRQHDSAGHRSRAEDALGRYGRTRRGERFTF